MSYTLYLMQNCKLVCKHKDTYFNPLFSGSVSWPNSDQKKGKEHDV